MPIPAFLTSQLLISVLVLLVVFHVILGGAGMCIYLERKISAYIQDRIGPNRVGLDFGLPFLFFLKGMWGLGQFVADGLKLFLKEDYTPARVDKILFALAPALVVIPPLVTFAIIPWGGSWDAPALPIPFLGWLPPTNVLIAGANISVGLVYILAAASLGVYGITLGGWASNNKYSFFGGLRATAQMISYEIPMGLSLLAVLLTIGSLLPEQIIRYQYQHGWLILSQPIAAALFYVTALAEGNRAPFDNAECEQELVGGFHTEFSSMRFALYPLAEYAHLITGSALFAMIFLGGFHLPLGFLGNNHPLSPENVTLLGVIAKIAVFGTKTFLLICFGMLIRWTIPRLRYDQVMTTAWQGAIPISLMVVVVTSVMVYFGQTSLLALLGANAAMFVVIMIVQPLMPSTASNARIPLYGSRYSPMEGERVLTRPTDPTALEDRPVQSAVTV
ncbi:MAG: NADH-quinone oxidoreductase subunit H [Phycisphaeraceae bacterium]|nr:NADH-quinone oxidoreductase subunit H [Phycisphaeraceae bacterium]